MNEVDLSILVPARNEEWLAETLEDLIVHMHGNTEVIVILDGETFPKPLPTDPRITVVKYETSVGQRKATNDAARLAKGKYLMKVDGHCAFDAGFDVKMVKAMQELGDNVTIVPVMRNLHVFNWLCKNGHRRYQGVSGPCLECGEPTEKEVVWIAKRSPQSTSYRFDTELHFQYFNSYKGHPDYIAQKPTGYTETMSMQGSCFMLSKEKYWELDICEETFGSWGAQGTEVACKTWLSGGRCVVVHNTWYGHLFRTQGGDFGFPYKQDNKQVENARKYSQRLFLDNTWPKQKLPLSWLVDRFAPVDGWHDGKDNGMLEKIREHGRTMV